MTRRPFWLLVHRWGGLAMTPFLIIVGLTGAVIPFTDELDAALNPGWFRVPIEARPLLDPLVLHDRVDAAAAPWARLDYAVLSVKVGESVRYLLTANTNPDSGRPYELTYDQLFFNPYTGEQLGGRRYAANSLDRENLMNFLNRLHYCLAMPTERLAVIGGYVLGITAVLWTLDCFVAFYLTLPVRRSSRTLSDGGSTRRRRWRTAWVIKWPTNPFRFNFDLHRATGLWTWVLLLVLAWSSVSLNLGEVYRPVTRALFGLRPDLPIAVQSNRPPALGWRAALETGRTLMREQARQGAFAVLREDTLEHDDARGAYVYTVYSNLDRARWPMTSVTFDATDGHLLRADWPGEPGEQAGDVVTRWITWLHMAAVFGPALQITISLLGVAIVGLAGTGVVIWWKKHKVRFARRGPTLPAR